MTFRDTHLKPLPIRGRRINLPCGRFPFAFLPKRVLQIFSRRSTRWTSAFSRIGLCPPITWSQSLCTTLHDAIGFFHHLSPYSHGPLLRSACRRYSIGESNGVTSDTSCQPFLCALGLRRLPGAQHPRWTTVDRYQTCPHTFFFGQSVPVPFTPSALTTVNRIHLH